MFVYDENKREANLEKHKLDFRDAWMVYFHPLKITLETERNNEIRAMDLALVEIRGKVFALVYTLREDDIRIISYRKASKKERKYYVEKIAQYHF